MTCGNSLTNFIFIRFVECKPNPQFRFSIVKLSWIHTSLSDSTKTWSYSLKATRNMMDVTFSKQWIHLRLSDLWPPTSTILKQIMHRMTI